MADLSAPDFDTWLRPRHAVFILGEMNEAVSKRAITTLILDGRIRMAARGSSKGGDESVRAPQPFIIDPNYLYGPWRPEWMDFWLSGRVSFVHVPIALPGFASLSTVGLSAALAHTEVHVFHEVRLDPIAVAREFDVDPNTSLGASPVQQVGLPPARKGGRPAGKHGGPMARITMRLLSIPEADLRRYTADALGIELIDEYRRLGLDPPSEENARRDAAGILNEVRK